MDILVTTEQGFYALHPTGKQAWGTQGVVKKHSQGSWHWPQGYSRPHGVMLTMYSWKEQKNRGIFDMIFVSHCYVWLNPTFPGIDKHLHVHEEQWMLFTFPCVHGFHFICYIILTHKFSHLYFSDSPQSEA